MAFVMLMAAFVGTAKAQSVSPVDFMRNNPHNVFANPAFFTSEYGYFDMGLGGINVNIQNIGLRYDKFFRFNENGQPVVVDLNQGVASLRNENYLNTFVDFGVFNCGRRTKYGYFTYNHRFRVMESLRYNKDMISLLVEGNAAFVGDSNPAKEELDLALHTYQEFDFGYQMCLTEQLNIGVRFKFLMGFANARSKALGFQLKTDPDSYALTASGALDLKATTPYQMSMEHGELSIVDSRFNIVNLFKNYGTGVDLGAEYKINEQFGIAAAINDFGFIKWNNHAVRFVGSLEDAGSLYHDGALVFEGLTQDQIDGLMNDPEYLAKFVDTLANYYDLRSEALQGYFTGLNPTMMVRGYYDLTPQHRFSAQLLGYFSGIGFMPALTLAYTGSFADKYDVVTSYTMMPGSYDNLGVGLSANFGGMLIYVATNSIFGLFNPANRTQMHVQLGLSFTSGQSISRSETIIIKDIVAEAESEKEE